MEFEKRGKEHLGEHYSVSLDVESSSRHTKRYRIELGNRKNTLNKTEIAH